MPFTNNGAMRLHWQQQGSGTPLLLIMGHRYSSRMWYPAIPALAQKHRVISFDNRGTGRSGTHWRFEVQDMVDDALAVMDAAGVDSAHVYGVSMGGGIALALAMRQPYRVRSLILGCTRLKTERQGSSRFMRALHYLPPPLLTPLLRALGGNRPPGSAADADAIAFEQDVIRTDPHSVLGIAAQSQAVARYATTREAASRLTTPALVLHGDEDRVVPYRCGVELASTLPNSRLETFKGAGHNYFLVDRERANRLALEFLQQVDVGASRRSSPATAAC
jgi:3-oxoadipate enol-lactonase